MMGGVTVKSKIHIIGLKKAFLFLFLNFMKSIYIKKFKHGKIIYIIFRADQDNITYYYSSFTNLKLIPVPLFTGGSPPAR